MSRATGIIEINGTRYDAATGNVVGAVKKVASQVKDQSKAIDGFVRKSGSYAKAKTETIKPKQPVRHIKSAKLVHNRTQRSHALMRTVVSKPKIEKNDSEQIKPSLSKAVGVEQERRSRASAIVRHRNVKRFGAPKPAAHHGHPAKTAIVAKARPMTTATKTATLPAPVPSMVVSASHQRLERMLDEALVRADAHKQIIARRSFFGRFGRLPRWLVIGLMALVTLLIVAFVLWREVPAVAIKVAGQQAHVNASLPSYTPSGFAMAGPINHVGGAVSIKYANTAGYSYDISQRRSGWDSKSLAANVLAGDTGVQTSQVQGTTVYIYGEHNDATWVNNGVWYSLTNQANLSSDQILRIVQSL